MIKLFAPEKSGKCLSLYTAFILYHLWSLNGGVKFIYFLNALFKNRIRFHKGRLECGIGESDLHSERFSRRNYLRKMCGGFRSAFGGIYTIRETIDNRIVDAILHVRICVRPIEQSLCIGFVVSE